MGLNTVKLLILLLAFSIKATLAFEDLSDNIIDVLTGQEMQSSTDIARQTSILEDLQNRPGLESSCLEELNEGHPCEGVESEFLNQHGHEDMRVLFEVQYQNLEEREPPHSTAAAAQKVGANQVEAYYKASAPVPYKPNEPVQLNQAIQIENSDDIRREAEKIATWLLENGASANEKAIYNHLVLLELRETQNFDEMMVRARELSGNMTNEEFIDFLSSVAGEVEYNHSRRRFAQREGAGHGRVGPYEQVMGQAGGICGDIHSMVAKFAEQRGYEAFTVGYATTENMHVVTAVVDPENPDNITIINYGNYEQSALDEGNSVPLTPTDMPDIGMQLRIFKNDETGTDGRMQQIATIPTALGSFMSDLFQKEGQAKRSMPSNQNYRRNLVEVPRLSSTSSDRTSDESVTLTNAGEGLMIYEGRTETAEIFGVALRQDAFENLYMYDRERQECVQKRSRYFSLGIAGSLVQMPQHGIQNAVYAYINLKRGAIYSLYQTDHVQFGGFLGIELDGFLAGSPERGFLSGDANFAGFAGVMADYQRGNTSIHASASIESSFGLRDQNLMTDLRPQILVSNLNPLNFNAAQLQLRASQQLNSNTAIFTENELSMTRVGGRFLLSAGLIKGNASFSVAYQGLSGSLPLGNRLTNINLLQNLGPGQDGFQMRMAREDIHVPGFELDLNGWVAMGVPPGPAQSIPYRRAASFGVGGQIRRR